MGGGLQYVKQPWKGDIW